METRRDHRLRVAVAVFAVALAGVGPAIAGDDDVPDWPDTITVETDPDNVTVEAETGGSTDGSNESGSSGPECHLKEPEPGDEILQNFYEPHKVPYYLECDDGTVSIVWLDYTVGEPGSGPVAQNPQDVALRLREEIPIPRAEVNVNPSRGLVGTESWFWIDGYDGQPIFNGTDAFGSLVEVEARVSHYRWSFGDGATVESTSPGRAYPERSQVRHTYERSSAGITGGYPVEATFTFQVRYRVDGGPWIGLPGISRTASATYPVRESQAVIQR